MKYEISNGTLAIVPNEDDNSLIYEDNERFIVEESPFKIMEDSCKYFGSTYKGRKDSAKEILGAEYKIPVVIEDSNDKELIVPCSYRSIENQLSRASRLDVILRKRKKL